MIFSKSFFITSLVILPAIQAMPYDQNPSWKPSETVEGDRSNAGEPWPWPECYAQDVLENNKTLIAPGLNYNSNLTANACWTFMDGSGIKFDIKSGRCNAVANPIGKNEWQTSCHEIATNRFWNFNTTSGFPDMEGTFYVAKEGVGHVYKNATGA